MLLIQIILIALAALMLIVGIGDIRKIDKEIFRLAEIAALIEADRRAMLSFVERLNGMGITESDADAARRHARECEILRAENAKLREGLSEIYTSSNDNWAAALAQRLLGNGGYCELSSKALEVIGDE